VLLILCDIGHGGDEFLKFQDVEEMSAQDFAFALKEMEIKRRYRQILIILDTCQASTLFNYISSPNVITIGSSRKSENSYGYAFHDNLRLPLMDRFTFSFTQYFQRQIIPEFGVQNNVGNWRGVENRDSPSLNDLMNQFQPRFLFSHPLLSHGLTKSYRNPKNVILTDFFSPYINDSLVIVELLVANACFQHYSFKDSQRIRTESLDDDFVFIETKIFDYFDEGSVRVEAAFEELQLNDEKLYNEQITVLFYVACFEVLNISIVLYVSIAVVLILSHFL